MRRNTLDYIQGKVFKGDMEKPIINDIKLNSLQINGKFNKGNDIGQINFENSLKEGNFFIEMGQNLS